LRRHPTVLLCYVGLSLLLTWPLALHFASHVPGNGIDDPSLAWNLWWAKHALVDQPQNPFACSWIFWPVGINLAFYTLTLLNGVLSIPLQSVMGVAPAYNLLLLSSFVLGGYGAYLFCRAVCSAVGARDHKARLACFLAGAFYAFASAKIFYAALGQGNVASSQWVPFAALYMLRAAGDRGRPRDAVLAAIFLTLQAYAEETYASFLVILAVLLLAWQLGRLALRARSSGALGGAAAAQRAASARGGRAPAAQVRRAPAPTARTDASPGPLHCLLHAPWVSRRPVTAGAPQACRAAGRRGPCGAVLGRFVLMAVLFLGGITPLLANMLPDMRAEGDFFTSGGGFAGVFSADLAGYFLPTELHPVFGSLTTRVAGRLGFPADKGQQIYLGYVALALAAIGAAEARSRARKGPEAAGPGFGCWAAAAGLFFLLTLGPDLRVAGHEMASVPLPYAWIARVPFFEGNRYPSRYSVMLLLALAPFVALGALSVLRRAEAWADPVRKPGRAPAALEVGASALRPPSLWPKRSGETGRAPGSNPAKRAWWPGLSFVVLLGLLLFEHLSVPLPLFDLRVPALYTKLAQVPGDFAVLEIPPGWRNGAWVLGKQDPVIMQEMWYQTVHGKRLLGGNTSRNPEFKFEYYAEDPTLARLIAQTNAADLSLDTALRAALAAAPITDADRARAGAWAAFLDLRYVVVHRDKIPPETESALQALLPLSLVAQDGPLALYALAPASGAPRSYALDSPAGQMALAEGWSPPGSGEQRAVGVEGPAGSGPSVPFPGASQVPGQPVYAERQSPRLLLPVGPAATHISLYGWSPGPGQEVALTVDGRPAASGPQALPRDAGWITFTVPADAGRGALSDVRLRFGTSWPVESLASAAELPATLASLRAPGLPAALLASSAGEETGDFAHIYVDGQDLAPDQRGYNLVALGPGAARAASFDTHLDPSASGRLAAWVAALPAGTLVAGAVCDEASFNLGPDAVRALATLGVAGDLRGHFRWSHAFIGVKGARPGAALESLNGQQPAQVSLGLPLTAPRVAAAVAVVTVGP